MEHPTTGYTGSRPYQGITMASMKNKTRRTAAPGPWALLLGAMALIGCWSPQPAPRTREVNSTRRIVDHHLMGEVSHGLHLIVIDDTTQVLIYRGVESCTMIEIR